VGFGGQIRPFDFLKSNRAFIDALKSSWAFASLLRFSTHLILAFNARFVSETIFCLFLPVRDCGGMLLSDLGQKVPLRVKQTLVGLIYSKTGIFNRVFCFNVPDCCASNIWVW
jgi:hypothetical protein